jgi:hypothetical protein
MQTHNLASILQILSVAKGDNAHDTILDALGQILDRAMCQRRALGVATSQEFRVGALRRRAREQIPHGGDAAEICATGEEVGGQEGRVVDALDGDVRGTKKGFEYAACVGSYYGALLQRGSVIRCVKAGRIEGSTMLPTSVEPRAKNQIASRQPPLTNSLEVVPTV